MVGLIKFNHMEINMTFYSTHPSINIDVKIPGDWDNISYHHDVCPSFKVKDLQIFVMDDQTRDEEEFDHKYTIMSEENYGDDKPPFLATNSWDEVLTFVSLYKSLTKGKDNADK